MRQCPTDPTATGPNSGPVARFRFRGHLMPNRALMLKLLSAAILFGAWEIAGRIPVSYAFPTFIDSMTALARMLGDGTMFAAYA